MKNLKVLLVDDEADFASALGERLKLRGIDAEIALDGDSAWEKIEAESFDVLVLDLLMPGLDGMTLMKKVKSSENNTPVILLTGHGSSRDGIEGMKQGAYEYLMKPVAFDELLEKIQKAAADR